MNSPPPEPETAGAAAEPMAITAPAVKRRRWPAGLAVGIVGFLVSGLGHVVVVVWGFGLWDMAQPLSAAPPAAVMVELVPDPWKTSKPTEESEKSAPSSPPQSAPAPQAGPGPPAAPTPQAEAAAAPPAVPGPDFAAPADIPTDPDMPTAARLAQMLQLPIDLPDSTDGGGAASEQGAKLTRTIIEDFKEHVQTCWTTPPEAIDDERVKVLIRVAFRRDGRLNGNPALVQGIATPAGPAVVRSAMAALEKCQPYAFLPAEEYRQWRLLEVGFSAKGVL